METEIFDFLMMACEQKEWQQVACDSYKPQFKIALFKCMSFSECE